jgi:hypothetical protein
MIVEMLDYLVAISVAVAILAVWFSDDWRE